MFILLILVSSCLLVESVSPEDVTPNDVITETSVNNKLSNEMLLSIIDDIVQSKSKKIYHTIYNVNKNTSICFKDYINTKEDNINGGTPKTWREFEFTFHYPGHCCNETNTKKPSGDDGRIKIITVVFENGERKPLPFEIVEKTSDYTIRRNVRVYCMSRLSVLDKSYFENRNNDQKKVVIKMSNTNEHHGDVLTVVQDQDEAFSSNPSHQDFEMTPKKQIGNANIDSVLGEIPDWNESTSINTSTIINNNSNNNKTWTVKENHNPKSNVELKVGSSEVKNIDNNMNQAKESSVFTSRKEINSRTVHNQSDNGRFDGTLLTSDHTHSLYEDNKHLVSNRDQPSSLVNEHSQSIKSQHSEASALSKLLSGKWVLSSLIDLGDDKIVVRGDITVSRKHE